MTYQTLQPENLPRAKKKDNMVELTKPKKVVQNNNYITILMANKTAANKY